MARRQIVEERPETKPTAEARTGDLFAAATGSRDPTTNSGLGKTEEGYKVTHTTEPGTPDTIRRRRPGGIPEATGDQPACHECGGRLTIMPNSDVVYACGHAPPHETPMQKGWKKETLPKIGTEPGHGKDVRTNANGEVIYCSTCRLAQFVDAEGNSTCTKGHKGALGMTANAIRVEDAQKETKTDRKDEPRPGGGSRYTALEQKLGSSDPRNSNVGDTVTVVWGKELFSQRQFHTIEVGPFTATTTLLPEETLSMAADRAMRELRGWAEHERERKIEEYKRIVGVK